MDIEDFRRHGHAMVDWMANYLETIEQRPVRAPLEPGALEAALPPAAPEAPEPFDALMADLDQLVTPRLTHWGHPRFLAYFPANATPPSILAEMATAALATNAMLWQTAPAASELEAVALRWLQRASGLPDNFVGSIQDSASTATFAALIQARERATAGGANVDGAQAGPKLRVYASEEAHSSIEKGARAAGYGSANLVAIETDGAGALRVDALRAAIECDRRAGAKPACIVATLGATGRGGVDPLDAIAAIAQENDAHLHVDAAWAGSALLLPEQRAMIEGVEGADSFVTNPHKWLGAQFDCAALYVKDPTALENAMAVRPSYLETTSAAAIDYSNHTLPLGRRFRALKLWFVFRSYGLEGLRAMLRRHLALARRFADLVDRHPNFERLSGPNLALVTFRWSPAGVDPAKLDDLNAALTEAINDDGRTYLTSAVIKGRREIRAAIGQWRTEERHIDEAFAAIVETAATFDPT